MGPVLLCTMVQSNTTEPQDKKLHPFFTKVTPDCTSHVSDQLQAPGTMVEGALESPEGHGSHKRHQDDGADQQDNPVSKKPRRSMRSGSSTANGSIMEHLGIARTEDQPPKLTEQSFADIPTPPLSDVSAIPLELPVLQPSTDAVGHADNKQHLPDTPPKKVLKFNRRTGTLGSPPKTKKNEKPSRVVTIEYGKDDESRNDISVKITQILDGTLDVLQAPKRGRPKRKTREPVVVTAPEMPIVKETPRTEKRVQSTPKATHPFFGGKTKPSPADITKSTERAKSPPRRQTIFMSTPMSPKKPKSLFPTPKTTNWGRTEAVSTKVPGAMHPAWPAQGMSHIRGDDGSAFTSASSLSTTSATRKSKGQVVTVMEDESVLGQLANRLQLNMVRDKLPRDDNVIEPPPNELRLPGRLFESGRKLQSRIRPELSCRPDQPTHQQSDIDELSQYKPPTVHPAVSQLYQNLQNQLSSFDRSDCESTAWAQKYAPTCTAQVLQDEKEALLLKQWLEALNLQAVHTGNADKAGSKGKGEKPAKKKRKNKLDGFVVDSDEEDLELNELSESESEWVPAGLGLVKKSVVQRTAGKEQSKISNAALISGPHGCGKTAAVYAVARELGFEVFEINSSTRRNGKDILDKVGDMTRNHLVHHAKADVAATEDETEDEVAKDIKSGKQGMMTAFFKPKTSTAPKKAKPAKQSLPDEESKAKSKSQKQSLILLEEVDILYEEDKQFWSTLMTLISQSRRPFIMTCTDESLVPIPNLNLHGIFRFSPPPQSLTVDVCLLIAANEGHALKRPAIEALYMSRGYDLRATISELNYWCQIGVGDRRGGFDWFYLRWPRGSDLDENGDTVRVISENTYMEGMGWMCRDVMEHCSSDLEAEEEAIRQCWDSWRVSASDWSTSVDMAACADHLSNMSTREARMSSLACFDDLYSSLSSSDTFAAGALGTGMHEVLDNCLPDLPQKIRDDFVLGSQLLEAEPVAPPTDLRTDISTAISSLSRQLLYTYALQNDRPVASSILCPVGETKAVSMLKSAFQHSPKQLKRYDLAVAFDPIAISDAGAPTTHLDPSVFDRTLQLIVLDVAPWVRSIVSYDQALMMERKKLSNLLSEGGTKKRMRTTRSAYSALEGGERRSTRREKYFQGAINTGFVLDTGLKSWRDAEREIIKAQEDNDQQQLNSAGGPETKESPAQSEGSIDT